jgi:hypothetical protein
MTQSTSGTKQDSGKPGRARKEMGWTPIVIGSVLLLVGAFVVTLFVHNSSPSSSAPPAAAGTKLWTKEVTLKVGQDYALAQPSATVDDACTNCILVEEVYRYGMAISDSGGLQLWQPGAPTYRNCATVLAPTSLPAVGLYDPPSNVSSKDARTGTYLCAYADDGKLLSLRYDGPTGQGNEFKFHVTAWSVG